MKIYLDDERTPPSGWKLLKTPKEVIKYLKTGKVEELSLDHDLGDDKNIGTGYDVLLWIEEQVYLHNFKPPKIKVHSANVSARTKMEAAIKNINKKSIGENILKKSELRQLIREELNKILSEKVDITRFIGNQTDGRMGFTEFKLNKKGILKITHAGNMGNSIKNSVDPNLQKMGLPKVEELKKLYKVVVEKGTPDYYYVLELKVK